MESEGVRKGEDIHRYIDIQDPAWGDRGQDETISLLDRIDAENKVIGDGRVAIGVLPEDIPLRITNGRHRLTAFCQYLVGHWDDISDHELPLASNPTECPFANGLSKSPAEVLAQEDASWIVKIEYIRE